MSDHVPSYRRGRPWRSLGRLGMRADGALSRPESQRHFHRRQNVGVYQLTAAPLISNRHGTNFGGVFATRRDCPRSRRFLMQCIRTPGLTPTPTSTRAARPGVRATTATCTARLVFPPADDCKVEHTQLAIPAAESSFRRPESDPDRSCVMPQLTHKPGAPRRKYRNRYRSPRRRLPPVSVGAATRTVGSSARDPATSYLTLPSTWRDAGNPSAN